jgi:hypothetical protein
VERVEEQQCDVQQVTKVRSVQGSREKRTLLHEKQIQDQAACAEQPRATWLRDLEVNFRNVRKTSRRRGMGSGMTLSLQAVGALVARAVVANHPDHDHARVCADEG